MRTRTLLWLTAVTVIFDITLAGVYAYVILPEFHAIDRREAAREMEHVLAAMDRERQQLLSTCGDWAYWDETYLFARGGAGSYVADNLQPDSLDTLRLDAMLVGGPSMDLIWAGVRDAATRQWHWLGDAPEAARLWGAIAGLVGPEDGTSGLIRTSRYTWLVAACPILRNDRSGAAAGVLAIARRCDSEFLAAIGPGVGPAWVGRDAPLRWEESDPVLAVRAGGPEAQGKVLVWDTRDNANTVAAPIPDIRGRATSLLQARVPSATGLAGRRVGVIGSVLLGSLVLAYIVVVVVVIEGVAVRRIYALNRQVSRLGPGELVSLSGTDEVAQLGAALNAMLERSEAAERSLRDSEARHRALFETMAHGVIYYDADGKAIDANRAVKNMLGVPRDEVVNIDLCGSPLGAAREDGTPLPPGEHPARVALSTGMPVRDVLLCLHAADRECRRWVVVNATPVFGQEGQRPSGAFITLADITTLVEADAARRLSAQRAEAVLQLN